MLAVLQMQRLQHGASGNSPCEGADKLKDRLSLECDEPSLVQGKAADSCSIDWWKELINDPLDVPIVAEGPCTSRCKELQASLVHTAGSKDVWVVDKALAEAISGGLLCSHARISEPCPRNVKECQYCLSPQKSYHSHIYTYQHDTINY